MSNIADNVIGMTFNKLTIIEDLGLFENGLRKVMAICECGKIKSYNLPNIRRPNSPTKSCGCIKKVNCKGRSLHGLAGTPLYKKWYSMINRCYNPKCRNYKNYGARGVTVCEEWRLDFLKFYEWAIINGWRDGLQLDKDKNGTGMIYSPDFCSFITCKENQNNKRSNKNLVYNGEKLTAAQWAEKFKISRHVMYKKLRKNIPLEEIISSYGKI